MLPQKNNSQNRALSLNGAIMETADTPTNCTRRAFARHNSHWCCGRLSVFNIWYVILYKINGYF